MKPTNILSVTNSCDCTPQMQQESVLDNICENMCQLWQILLYFTAQHQQNSTLSSSGRQHFLSDTFNHPIYMWRWWWEKCSSLYHLWLLYHPSLSPFWKVWTPHSGPHHCLQHSSQLKSTGHVCFFRNDKCCTLAVPLPTSHLSWLQTFYSCQLFHLTLT